MFEAKLMTLRTQFIETEGKDTFMFDLKPAHSIELKSELETSFSRGSAGYSSSVIHPHRASVPQGATRTEAADLG